MATPNSSSAASAPPKRAAAKRPVKRPSASTTRANSPSRARANARKSTTAERAVLIPVGAALIARERVFESVNETISSYNSASKATAQLRKFERRGSTARNQLEREVRKTRVRVERELRQTRTRVEHEVSRRRRDSEQLATRLQERLQSLV
jgi:hypothetical protein